MADMVCHMAAVKHPTKREEDKESARVESPVAAYGAVMAPGVLDTIDHWISVLRQFGMKASTTSGSGLSQVREALRTGVPRQAFEDLRNQLGVGTEELADVLGIPTRTLARRTDRFKSDESERVLRLGSVMFKARDVLEDPAALRRWMTQPKRALGGLTPLRCCDSEMGAREVEALLTRIEFGVFS
jgi:putative toxin-antitoxin system antitoxin component (TIGR02293 family)